MTDVTIACSGDGMVCLEDARRPWPHDGSVHVDDALREHALVQLAHGVAARGSASSAEHALECRGDRVGTLIRAQLAAANAVQPLRDDPDRDRHDSEITG